MTKKGSITVFLALMLSVVLTLAIACIQSVRMAAARTQILNSVDVGIFSLFGHYDRTMLEDYDLLVLNANGSGQGNSGNLNLASLYDIFLNYMKPILKQNSQKLSMQQGGISGYILLTDQNGDVFYQQAVQYMKDTIGSQGITLLKNMLNHRTQDIKDAENRGQDAENSFAMEEYEQEMEYASNESAEMEKAMVEESDEDDWEDNSENNIQISQSVVNNPIPVIKQIRSVGILGLVLPTSAVISGKTVEEESLLSERTLQQGFQMTLSQTVDHSQVSELLFQQYLRNKMGSYINPAQGALSYQNEYILFNEKTDMENLSKMAERLMLVREGINLAHIMTDSTKRAEVKSLALGISSMFLVPPAAGIIEQALYLCWSFAESVLDVRTLFEGKKIPITKNNGNWQLSLERLPDLLTELNSIRRSDSSGMSYEDYLLVFMMTENHYSKVKRTMDMIECDMRKKLNSKTFQLDSCVYGMSFRVDVNANSVKTFQVEKDYRYE